MADARQKRRGFTIAVLLWAAFVGPLFAYDDARDHVDQMRRQAERYEQRGDFARACDLYERLLVKQRPNADLKERYLTCLRRAQQARRLRDLTYRKQITDLSLPAALELYGELLTRLRAAYVDRDKVEPAGLFKQGVEELRRALGDERFRREQMPTANVELVRAFQEQLRTSWASRPVRKAQDAQALARDLALSAQKTIGLKPTLAVLELASGACAGLDEYSAYLTPGQYADVAAAWRGEVVGVGVELAADEERLVVTQVLPGSPAEMAGVKSGDRLVRVEKKQAAGLPADAAADLLRGEAGSVVELAIQSPGDAAPRVVKLLRQAVSVPSVSEPRFLGGRMAGIGYVQITGFQDTTVVEFDEALVKLQMSGLRVLVLDLRGNPGGLVDVAVQVAERFLQDGVVASTRGQLRAYNRVYEARNTAPLTVPLVVLIDGETASAAEMLAGALKDHKRATLVGQTTFGKGTIQRYWELATFAAGLRLTVARFYSPLGQPYGDTGVTPDVVAERPAVELSLDIEHDPQVRAALDAAARLLMGGQ